MKSFFNAFRNQLLFVVFLSLSAAIGYAVTLPNTFTSGTPAVAEDVNANFDALKTAVDTLETKIATLEATSLPSETGKLGYALINADGSVNAAYSFNSSGGGITATMAGTGVYTVTFAGLGGDAISGGHVQVTPAGFFVVATAICRTTAPVASDTPDVLVRVYCQDPAASFSGVPFGFWVMYMR